MPTTPRGSSPSSDSSTTSVHVMALNGLVNMNLLFTIAVSFFLFSSLVAQGLKLAAINLLNSKDVDKVFRATINQNVLRLRMMGSAMGSVMGWSFLVLLMVHVIKIQLGMLSCGSKPAIHVVGAPVLLVSSALMVCISTAFYAFMH
ncbi:hypothetical protein SLEP1_g31864 [Rubroshorea leprosula]|uniref:Uncharacterized protein n=1 Tax=Rubroshorea leprosula TaxID=152421 RepID=A0AAV5KBI9_9ROSI|nr:hypothetical protein SLEP1_g31864 [Rubroshorea leprosula]